MNDAHEALVFDLGGVLIEFGGFEALAALLPEPLGSAEIRSRWIASPAVTAFERGHIGPREFGERFVAEWPISLSAEDFVEAFRSWVLPLSDEARALVADLAGRRRIACLSNCNELHWETLGPPVEEHFEHAFVSFQLGLAKPDRRIFEHMVSALRVAPERIVFFDDTDENVAAARNLGIRSECVRGLEDLRARLRALGHLAGA